MNFHDEHRVLLAGRRRPYERLYRYRTGLERRRTSGSVHYQRAVEGTDRQVWLVRLIEFNFQVLHYLLQVKFLGLVNYTSSPTPQSHRATAYRASVQRALPYGSQSIKPKSMGLKPRESESLESQPKIFPSLSRWV